MANGTLIISKKTSCSRKKEIETICEAVLIFPGIAAAKTLPLFSTINVRKPVIANSRITIMATIQAGTQSN